MKLTIVNTDFHVSWEHVKLIDSETHSHETICIIEFQADYFDSPSITNGHAYCHRNDNFNRATGRKLSLTKALKELFPSPSQKWLRAMFWKAYSEQIGFKKNKKG